MNECDIYVGHAGITTRFRAKCLAHNTEGQFTHRTSHIASHRFVCDKGENLRFLLCSDETDSFLGFFDLGETVNQFIISVESAHYGGERIDLAAWRIAHTSPLKLELRPTRLVLISAGEYDENQYKSMLYHFVDENGQLITEFYVHIDGRA